MKLKLLLQTLFAVIAAAGFSVWAQTAKFPFPQNRTYPFGRMPQARNHLDAQTAYNDWKTRFVTASGAGGFQRVLGDDCSSCTVSEGIGYGMLLAVNYNDQPLFNNLWGYYNLHINTRGLMSWKISASGVPLDVNAATDGDEDVAFALVVADRQWGSGTTNYLQFAKNLINKILQYEVEADTYVLKPGDVWGGSNATNPSYFAPAYYRLFKEVTGKTEWDQVINKCYTILQAAAHPTTGLVPDWCKADGMPVSCTAFPNNCSYDYKYDACRTPWRIALDYVWFGNVSANNFCQKITAFANGIGASNIVSGYTWSGTPLVTYRDNAFAGTFACGAMAGNYQSYCDAAYLDNRDKSAVNYYNASWKALTLFVQTGNFNYTTPPVAPNNLVATAAGGSQINLTWTDNANNESGFKIERKTGSAGAYAEITTVGANVTGYPNAGLTASTTYYYRVRAYNSAGNSAYSNEASATTASSAPNLALNKPATASSTYTFYTPAKAVDGNTSTSWSSAPITGTNITQWLKVDLQTATAISRVVINWNPTYFAKKYQLQVSTNNSTWTTLYTNNDGNDGIHDITFTPVTARYVRVYMTLNNVLYYSVRELEVYINGTPPPAPTNLTAVAFNSSQINLSWAENAHNESGFKIERKTGAGGAFAQIAMVGGNVKSYSDASLLAGISYYYRVRAYNVVGNSAYSNEANATVSTNLALNRTATASSTYKFYTPAKAVDGNTTSSWSSEPITSTNKTQWLHVDLQASKTVGRVAVNWNGAYFAAKYQLQISTNNTSWTTVHTDNAGNGGIDNITFPAAVARYVRVYMTLNNSSVIYYSVLELEVYSSSTASLGKEQNLETNAAVIPEKVNLSPNYPNPFNPTTAIFYAVPEPMRITLKVYNMAGQEVATLAEGRHEPGVYTATFDASRLTSGTYFAVLQAGMVRQVQRMTLVK